MYGFQVESFTNSEDVAKGEILIACPSALHPYTLYIQRPPQLEIVGITAHSVHSRCRICIVTVYRHPQQPLAIFLPLIYNYLANANVPK